MHQGSIRGSVRPRERSRPPVPPLFTEFRDRDPRSQSHSGSGVYRRVRHAEAVARNDREGAGKHDATGPRDGRRTRGVAPQLTKDPLHPACSHKSDGVERRNSADSTGAQLKQTLPDFTWREIVVRTTETAASSQSRQRRMRKRRASRPPFLCHNSPHSADSENGLRIYTAYDRVDRLDARIFHEVTMGAECERTLDDLGLVRVR